MYEYLSTLDYHAPVIFWLSTRLLDIRVIESYMGNALSHEFFQLPASPFRALILSLNDLTPPSSSSSHSRTVTDSSVGLIVFLVPLITRLCFCLLGIDRFSIIESARVTLNSFTRANITPFGLCILRHRERV